MSTLALPAIVRGATLDIAMRMPGGFPDGHLAGWVPTSQIRTTSGQLIATLDVQWVDPLTTRYLRLRRDAGHPGCVALRPLHPQRSNHQTTRSSGFFYA